MFAMEAIDNENLSFNSTSPIKRSGFSSPATHNLELEDSFTESDSSLLSCSPSTPRGNSKSPVPNISSGSICPPTPLPTPNWVQRTKGRWGRIARKNSLAATKTLLEINDGFHSPMDLTSRGQTFRDSFEIIAKLGEGHFSEVFKVRCRSDGEVYAVKKSKRLLRSKSDREVCLQEARNFQALDVSPKRKIFQRSSGDPSVSPKARLRLSPPSSSSNTLTVQNGISNIVRYFKAWQEEGYMYMQMELCEAGSINDKLHNLVEPIAERTIWRWIRDIAMGLAHMHSCHIVHVDIKPENIMIGRNGILKLGDLGLACRYRKAAPPLDSNNGDSRYLALETLRSPPSPASDIFSFGMSVFEIAAVCCGMIKPEMLPKRGKKWLQLRQGQPHVDEMSEQYSKFLRNFIVQLLQPHRSRRPQAAQILCHSKVLEHLEKRIAFPATPMKYDWTKLPTPSKGDVNLEHEMAKNEVSKSTDALFCSSPTSSSDDFSPVQLMFADVAESNSAPSTERKASGTGAFRRRLDIFDVHEKRRTSGKRAGSGGFAMPQRPDGVVEVSNPQLDDIRTTLF